ncbi:LOW QUALITY PROTEIN: protein split ends [Procambarus clarkii]|uniref:LOW QUALITY PROTEIN: protein split ends n=1 Tax=Procambarus clarkii TaxID=6728 RepID=UPI0037438493
MVGVTLWVPTSPSPLGQVDATEATSGAGPRASHTSWENDTPLEAREMEMTASDADKWVWSTSEETSKDDSPTKVSQSRNLFTSLIAPFMGGRQRPRGSHRGREKPKPAVWRPGYPRHPPRRPVAVPNSFHPSGVGPHHVQSDIRRPPHFIPEQSPGDYFSELDAAQPIADANSISSVNIDPSEFSFPRDEDVVYVNDDNNFQQDTGSFIPVSLGNKPSIHLPTSFQPPPKFSNDEISTTTYSSSENVGINDFMLPPANKFSLPFVPSTNTLNSLNVENDNLFFTGDLPASNNKIEGQGFTPAQHVQEQPLQPEESKSQQPSLEQREPQIISSPFVPSQPEEHSSISPLPEPQALLSPPLASQHQQHSLSSPPTASQDSQQSSSPTLPNQHQLHFSTSQTTSSQQHQPTHQQHQSLQQQQHQSQQQQQHQSQQQQSQPHQHQSQPQPQQQESQSHQSQPEQHKLQMHEHHSQQQQYQSQPQQQQPQPHQHQSQPQQQQSQPHQQQSNTHQQQSNTHQQQSNPHEQQSHTHQQHSQPQHQSSTTSIAGSSASSQTSQTTPHDSQLFLVTSLPQSPEITTPQGISDSNPTKRQATSEFRQESSFSQGLNHMLDNSFKQMSQPSLSQNQNHSFEPLPGFNKEDLGPPGSTTEGFQPFESSDEFFDHIFAKTNSFGEKIVAVVTAITPAPHQQPETRDNPSQSTPAGTSPLTTGSTFQTVSFSESISGTLSPSYQTSSSSSAVFHQPPTISISTPSSPQGRSTWSANGITNSPSIDGPWRPLSEDESVTAPLTEVGDAPHPTTTTTSPLHDMFQPGGISDFLSLSSSSGNEERGREKPIADGPPDLENFDMIVLPYKTVEDKTSQTPGTQEVSGRPDQAKEDVSVYLLRRQTPKGTDGPNAAASDHGAPSDPSSTSHVLDKVASQLQTINQHHATSQSQVTSQPQFSSHNQVTSQNQVTIQNEVTSKRDLERELFPTSGEDIEEFMQVLGSLAPPPASFCEHGFCQDHSHDNK